MYFNKEYFRTLAPKIRMCPDALAVLEELMPRFSPEEADKICRYLVEPSISATEKREYMGNFANENENGDLLSVLLYMAASGYTHENYKKKGIPDAVFYDTMNCLPEKMETHKKFNGTWGYSSPIWPVSHLNMTIFRIGRLGYQFCDGPHDPIMAGDIVLAEKDAPYIYMHISDNEKLVGCAESVHAAREFFREFYPEYGDCAYTTMTWLLDPRLGEFLPPQSNIMQFQSIFNIYGRQDARDAILPRVFGEIKENLDEYEPTTSLARGVLSYLKSGKELGRGFGYTKF